MKKLLSIFLITLLTFTSNSFAAAVAPTRVQSSISNVIQYKLQQRGFAANDPLIGTTLTGVSSALGAAATAAGAIALFPTPATPVWAAVGAVLGVASIMVGGVAWYMSADGNVTVPGTTIVPDVALLPGQCYSIYGYGCSLTKAALGTWWTANMVGTGTSCGGYTTSWGVNGAGLMTYSRTYQAGGCGYPAGYVENGILGAADIGYGTPLSSPGGSPTMMPASGAWSQIPASALSQPLDNQFIADLANKAMLAASQQAGYAGVAPQTITAADVATAQATSPSAPPTLADALAPQAAPAGAPATDPFALPAANPVANIAPGTAPLPSTNPVTSPVLDWGIPNDGSVIPTKNVAVSYTPTIFSTASGCPAPISFSMFGKTYFISWEPMCNLMSTVSIIFLALGAAAAALIFAEAFKPS